VKAFIRNLSAPTEFCLVSSLWLAPLVFIGCRQYWTYVRSGNWQVNNGMMIESSIIHLMILPFILWIWKIRNWSLGTSISWRGTGGGVLLAIVTRLAMVGVMELVGVIYPEQPHLSVFRLAVLAMILHSIAIPVFEEVLEAGYFIRALERFGMWAAILGSALLRASYHLWAGFPGMSGIFVMGIIMGYAYWRWRQLWPLVVAHTLSGFWGLYYMSYHATT
jgi:membrane protease YdiL (CAAX protease family)